MIRSRSSDPRPWWQTQTFEAVVLGGLVAGTLDIVDAFTVTAMSGNSPIRVLHAIASGVVGGRAAASGGAATAALGLALHFIIAAVAAGAFFVAARIFPVLLRRPVLSGVVYGLWVWAVMYHVVLPTTFGRPYSVPAWPLLVNQLGIHALGVGLPIALAASRAARRANTSLLSLKRLAPLA